MPIDPITGVTMGLVQTAANAKLNSDYAKNLKSATDRHSDTVVKANQTLHSQAVARTGGNAPLGWLYSGSVGSYQLYYTKDEYLKKIMPMGIIYDKEICGWNREWGDFQTEYAKARREYCASRDLQNAEKILATPLENFHVEIQHLESYAEKQARKEEEYWDNFWNSLGETLIGLFKFAVGAGAVFVAVRFIALLLFGV